MVINGAIISEQNKDIHKQAKLNQTNSQTKPTRITNKCSRKAPHSPLFKVIKAFSFTNFWNGHRPKNVLASLKAMQKSRLAVIIKVKRPELGSSSMVPVH